MSGSWDAEGSTKSAHSARHGGSPSTVGTMPRLGAASPGAARLDSLDGAPDKLSSTAPVQQQAVSSSNSGSAGAGRLHGVDSPDADVLSSAAPMPKQAVSSSSVGAGRLHGVDSTGADVLSSAAPVQQPAASFTIDDEEEEQDGHQEAATGARGRGGGGSGGDLPDLAASGSKMDILELPGGLDSLPGFVFPVDDDVSMEGDDLDAMPQPGSLSLGGQGSTPQATFEIEGDETGSSDAYSGFF